MHNWYHWLQPVVPLALAGFSVAEIGTGKVGQKEVL
jgi:hypothetical protein